MFSELFTVVMSTSGVCCGTCVTAALYLHQVIKWIQWRIIVVNFGVFNLMRLSLGYHSVSANTLGTTVEYCGINWNSYLRFKLGSVEHIWC